MAKIPIYFMPGLAAGPEIFEHLKLSSEIYEFYYLEWIEPIDLDESIFNYALRITKDIQHINPVLVGVSFGGILVQEVSKLIATRKVIIISSVKTHHELSKRFKESITPLFGL